MDFDLYLFNVEREKLVTVTTDGAENTIYNGIPDWVYEGTLLGGRREGECEGRSEGKRDEGRGGEGREGEREKERGREEGRGGEREIEREEG